jgi:glutaminyl-tRNA synthetase
MSAPDLVELFVKIGLEPKFAKSTTNNKKISDGLYLLIQEAGLVESGADKVIGTHLLAVATKAAPFSKGLFASNRKDLIDAIVSGDIKTGAQCTAAIQYFTNKTAFDKTEFNAECGVGVVVTEDDMKAAIEKLFADNMEEITSKRYQVQGKYIAIATGALLPWSDKKTMKDLFDAKFLEVCGPKLATDATVNKGQQVEMERKAADAKREEQKKAQNTENPEAAAANDDDFVIPDDNYLQGRQLDWAINTEEQLSKHNEVTKGRVITRFPPEPNGYLHIGHAKAMMQNFGVADKFNGHCIMRFDDTNPEAEEQEYIDTILENLEALGHKPWKTTYSSDYFQELFDLAVKLIKKNKAFVCHQTKEDIKRDRDEAKKTGIVPPSPYRNRSVEENLELFENMRKGLYKENECTLRMRGDLSSPNPNLWDAVFYRIRYTPHPHTGNKWCIYPTYDYTHCIIDSLEDITYSMCTLEFEIRRESYFWLLYELDLYKPKVWEYSRLNITHNVLSKRRLRSLVMDNHVNGWDDPRLLTINGLRRRGFSGPIINHFIKSIGISRSATLVPMERLNGAARELLNVSATRTMAVVDPVKVIVDNFEDNFVGNYAAANLPVEGSATHNITLSKTLYIEREDVWVVDQQGPVPGDYKRLTTEKAVHLKYTPYEININSVEIDPVTKKVTVVHVNATEVGNKPVKGRAVVHFVSSAPGTEPTKVELRMYNELFKSPEPMGIDEWEKDLNPNSLVIQHGYIDNFTLNDVQSADNKDKQYQFERIGYFILDKDSVCGEHPKLVFNRTCPLRANPIAK